VLSKGYGKQLISYIEQYLKSNGKKYIVLSPLSKRLIKYYTDNGYVTEIIPNKDINKENDDDMVKAYKKLRIAIFNNV
jgi:GNAT superfamily N-acetyltransferase